MANLNVVSWNPNKEVFLLRAFLSTTPGNATAVIDEMVIPTIPRPDGASASASTGGSANVRFVVDKVTWKNGVTISAIVGSLTVKLVNQSNSDAVIATKALAAGDVDVAGDTATLTLATTSTTRNSVSVKDIILLGGDVIEFQATGTDAGNGDLVKIGAALIVEGHWEEQLQVVS